MNMVTRRTVLGTGLAIAAVARIPGADAHAARAIDALLIDEGIEMPREVAAFIEASRRTLPVAGIQLDAAAHARVKRTFDQSLVIVGISSGATLFCLERIGWDHGFRLTGRTQQCVRDAGEAACWLDVAAYLTGAQPAATSPALIVRAYRPSRADGTLHAWIMRKPAHREA